MPTICATVGYTLHKLVIATLPLSFESHFFVVSDCYFKFGNRADKLHHPRSSCCLFSRTCSAEWASDL